MQLPIFNELNKKVTERTWLLVECTEVNFGSGSDFIPIPPKTVLLSGDDRGVIGLYNISNFFRKSKSA